MTDPNYAAFTALDPFFDIVQQGLAGLVDGDHYFDIIAVQYRPLRDSRSAESWSVRVLKRQSAPSRG